MIAPSTGFIALISVLFSVILLFRDSYSLWQTLALFPLLYAGCALVAAAFSIALKWALVWRYRPGERPLWSSFVWRNELLNAVHEHFAGPFVVDALTGTPFICWYFRLLGAKIGRRVYMETSDLSEFDLVSIGDEAAVNSDATLQTHLFEDRVMKMSSITLGRGSSVGAVSLVLYDSEIQSGASLGASSLLMKGETLPENSHWQGIPARALSVES
jgi:non-ribosomal peptide synthetase-like protein